MLQLLPLMLERVGLLLILAFCLTRTKSFRRIIHHEHGWKEKWMLIVVFGVFGMISNYTGIQIADNEIYYQAWHIGVNPESAIANTRIMGVIIGGLLGGPAVGIGVGLLAGSHRLLLGGFTSVACGVSTLLSGIISGFIGRKFRANGPNAAWQAMLVGILAEALQMGIILLASSPFDRAWALVQIIAVPMIIINGFGTWLFMIMIQSIFREEEHSRAMQTHKVLSIADETLPYFRQGLNASSCLEAARIILRGTNADAVAITDKEYVLAHVGVASDHHVANAGITTQLTRQVLQEGVMQKVKSREEIHCPNPACPLNGALVLPLYVKGATVGTLKLYFKKASALDQVSEELGEGLSKLFSTQLELAEAEQQGRLLKDARIKALQAQIHPHFLFNALNTISALCRTDPEKARKLLIQLSAFFRSNLQGARSMVIPLSKELEHVDAYLTLEQARFPDRYVIHMEIEPELYDVRIPPFTLQPLVENAIHHGFGKGFAGPQGTVTIRAWREGGNMKLITTDNGVGIDAATIERLGKGAVSSEVGSGTALHSINKRVEEIYNRQAGFEITSRKGEGTTVTLTLPIQYIDRGDNNDQGIYRG